jgi:hypothetical protein
MPVFSHRATNEDAYTMLYDVVCLELMDVSEKCNVSFFGVGKEAKHEEDSSMLPRMPIKLYRTTGPSTPEDRVQTSQRHDLWKVAGSRLDKVKFSIYLILPAALGPGVYSASNRNENRKH